MDRVPGSYQRPFHLFYYNRPKLPELPKVRKVKYADQPKIAVRYNNATKLRDKAIRECAMIEKYPYVNYGALTERTIETLGEPPEYVPRDTKTSQYRYKWVRDVPVVSCHFTQHVMMHKKPPFSLEKIQPCGQFRLRHTQLESPQPEPERREWEREKLSSFPGILQ